MNNKALVAMGIPAGPCADEAKRLIAAAHAAGSTVRAAGDALQPIVASPDAYLADARYGELASHLKAHQAAAKAFIPRSSSAPYRIWGEHLEPDSVRQLQNACSLPVAVAGALMPDAHIGYGLPIGGVLATENAVIPYAVGVDIACRMKMTVLDLPVEALQTQRERLDERART